MARTRSPRLKLWRWSLDSDTQARSDFDDDAAQLEALVALASNGPRSARPAPGVRDRLYFANDIGALYYDTGAAWLAVGAYIDGVLTTVGSALIGGDIRAAAGSLVVGDQAVTTQRVVRTQMKGSADGLIYQGQMYLYQGGTDAGLGLTLVQNAVEVGRLQIQPNGQVTVKFNGGGTRNLVQDVDVSTTSGFSSAANFVNDGHTVRNHNGVVTLQVRAHRTGPTLAANGTTGNFADTPICTIPAGVDPSAFRPNASTHLSGQYTGSSGGASGQCGLYITSGGVVTLASGAPGVDLASGGTVSATATYLAA